MDLSILFAVFDDFLKCPQCGQDVALHVDMKQKHGYSHNITLQCTTCEWKHCFNTSKKQGQSYEINVRADLAFREIGKGQNAMVAFSKVLTMPAPPKRDNCKKFKIKKSYQ